VSSRSSECAAPPTVGGVPQDAPPPPRRRVGAPTAFVALLAAALLIALVGPRLWRRHGGAAALSGDAPDVVLVSIDTLRFDAVRGDGPMRAATPALDALMKSGRAFDRAHAHVPLTLPSHSTVFTGRLPPQLKLHDNAPFPLRRDVPTLATLLSDHGYATAAVVGGQPLAEGCGLERGFERYDSPPRGRAGAAAFGERDAMSVTDAALGLLKGAAGGRRRFLFVHYFDCHQPYDPPPEFIRGDPTAPIDRYRGEAAYVDHELARFVAALRATSRRWLLVLFSDHGEGLGDHGEETHGYQVFESTVHVPLLFAEIEGEATRPPAGLAADDDRLVGLCDVFPTTLRCLGLPVPDGTFGTPLQEPAAHATAYVESLAGHLQFGWAQVTGVRAAQATLVHAGADVPDDLDGLFARKVAGDPESDERLLVPAATSAPDASELSTWRRELAAARAAPGGDVPEGIAKLSAIGYLAGSRDPQRLALLPFDVNAELPSPLGRRDEVKELIAAIQQLDRGEAIAAAATLDRILARDPVQRAALLHRARARLALRSPGGTGAVAAGNDLEELLRLDPLYPGARPLLAKAYGLTGRFQDAFATAEQARESEPEAVVERLLGSLHLTPADPAGRANPRADRERGANELLRSLELDPSQSDLALDVERLLAKEARGDPPPAWLAAAQERLRRIQRRRYRPPRSAYSKTVRRFRASGGAATRRHGRSSRV